MKNKKPDGKFFVKVSCIVGIFVLLFFLSILVWTGLRTKNHFFGQKNQFDKVSFVDKLQKFDELYQVFLETGKLESAEYINALFHSLEKTALGAEGKLSVLKRRRLLAKVQPAFFPDYITAVENAAAKFPHSALIAALAGEAVVWQGVNAENAGKLNAYAQVLAGAGPLGENSFFPLAFSLYTFSGALKDLASAAAVAKADEVILSVLRDTSAASFEALSINAALLKIIRQRYDEAAHFLVPLNTTQLLSERSRDFFANYAYDFDDLILAARLWTESLKEVDIARAGDAFFLAGRYENARQMWKLIALDNSSGKDPAILARSLYNLASTSEQNSEKIDALERLLAASGGAFSNESFVFGTVLYTRLVSETRGAAILKETFESSSLPLFDLELFRRTAPQKPIDRAIAETWVLINRHETEPFIYEWAAWFFNFHRRYNETLALADRAQKRQLSSVWLPFNRAIIELRGGDYPDGLKMLEDIEKMYRVETENELKEEIWPVNANIGLVLEAQHDFFRALGYFKTARDQLILRDNGFSLHKNSRRKNAALLELKLARCYTVLQRPAEAREAVLNAALLDGENINVRVASDQLNR